MDNLRDKAKEHILEAYKCLKNAGVEERLADIAANILWREKELEEHNYYDDYFDCSVCVQGHDMRIRINKEIDAEDLRKFNADIKYNYQYNLVINIDNYYYHYSLWKRIKSVFRVAKAILFKCHTRDEILIKGDDLTRFKDILKYL